MIVQSQIKKCMLAVLGMLLLLVTQSVANTPERVVAAGCKTEYFLVKLLADAYRAETGETVVLGSTGNKKAMAMMQKEKVDFAFTCKHVNKLTKKLKIDTQLASNWESLPLAKDPIVVVTHPGNGVSNLTTSELTSLFEGKIKNWSEVGGKDLPVIVSYINPEMESGMLLLFKEFTVGAKGQLAADAKIINDPKGLGRYVKDTPGAITFMTLVSYDETYGDIAAIEGVVPSVESVLDDSYSLSATYFLTVEKTRSAKVDKFVSFARSDLGRNIIKDNFVPLN